MSLLNYKVTPQLQSHSPPTRSLPNYKVTPHLQGHSPTTKSLRTYKVTPQLQSHSHLQGHSPTTKSLQPTRALINYKIPPQLQDPSSTTRSHPNYNPPPTNYKGTSQLQYDHMWDLLNIYISGKKAFDHLLDCTMSRFKGLCHPWIWELNISRLGDIKWIYYNNKV